MSAPPIENIYELTPTQQGMLFHSVTADRRDVYIFQLSFLVEGNLQTEAFRDAWQQVVNRHPVLRTSFYWEDLQKPQQVVHRSAQLEFNILDWRGRPAGEQEKALETFLTKDRQRGFELDHPPLLRLTLLQTGPEAYQLILTHHHIILDGWCFSIIFNEMAAFYRTSVAGQTAVFPLVVPYSNYLNWLHTRDSHKTERFWRAYLQGKNSPTRILSGAETTGSAEFARTEFRFTEKETAALNSLARENHLTLNSLMQGAWTILLQRISGENDVVYGTAVSGRPPDLPDAERIMGLFISTLPVRIQIDPDERLTSFLQTLQENLTDIRRHEYAGLAQIQTWSEMPPGTPLFDTIFVFENYPLDPGLLNSIPGLRFSNVRAGGWTNYPLSWVILPGREVAVILKYHTPRFTEANMQQLMADYRALLLAMISQPDLPIKKLDRHAGSDGNRIDPVVPADREFIRFPVEEIEQTVIGRFRKTADHFPDHTALSSRGKQITYRHLNRLAAGIARQIMDIAPAAEQVALLFNHDAPMIAAILGILGAGKTYVPLDPQFPASRLNYLLRDAEAKLLLCDTANRETAVELATAAKIPCLQTDAMSGSDTWPEVTFGPDDHAYILYTSGSTGQPKGVVQNQRNLLQHIRNYTNNLKISSRDRLSLLPPYGFDAALMDIFGALLNGAALCIFDLRNKPIDQLPAWLETEKINIYHSTPTIYRHLMAAVPPDRQFSSVRLIVLGGEAVFRQDLDTFRRHFSRRSFLVNGLGPSECTVCLQQIISVDTFLEGEKIPVGRPVEGVQAVLLDSLGNIDPASGEIAVKSNHVALGYWKLPELTNRYFSEDPEQPGQRIYRTGDMARRLPDGRLVFVGRKDGRIKLRGHRIEPHEIEARLEEIDSVAEAAVVLRNGKGGEGRLVAFLVPRQEVAPDETEIRGALRKTLPHFMIPAHFIVLNKLPLTSTGKLDRPKLEQMPVPETNGAWREAPPASKMEKRIAGIWRQELEMNEIGIGDTFFDLGGHSLLAMKVVSRLKKEVGCAVNPRMLAIHTLGQLARSCEKQLAARSTKPKTLPEKILNSIKKTLS